MNARGGGEFNKVRSQKSDLKLLQLDHILKFKKMPKAPQALKKDKKSDPSSSSSSARAPKPKKGGRGNGKEASAVYSTLDEALEAGVDAEENGERWSVGYKAQKSYETALSLYQQATRLDSSSADAFYNV